MRFERVNKFKIKVILSHSDLIERGIEKVELWEDIPKVHEFFYQLMEEAEDKHQFTSDGPIAVEVFAQPDDGIIIEVTKSNNSFKDELESCQIESADDIDLLYMFQSLDDVIYVCEKLLKTGVRFGELFFHHERYFLLVMRSGKSKKDIQAVLSEFGTQSKTSYYELQDYGKMIMDGECIKKIVDIFLKT